MIMFRMYVGRQRFSLLLVLSSFALIALTSTSAIAADGKRELYLIAATPSRDIGDPQSSISQLLKISDNGKVEPVRNLVSVDDDVETVRLCGTAAFLLSPTQSPHSVTVVHKQAPTVMDVVSVNSIDGFVDLDATVCVEKPSGSSMLLVPFSSIGKNSLPGKYNLTGVVEKHPRSYASPEDPSEYEFMRISGIPVGPTTDGDVRAQRVGNTLGVLSGVHFHPIFTIPPKYLDRIPIGQYRFLARDDRATIVIPLITEQRMKDSAKGSWKRATAFYIEANGKWRTIDLPGTCSNVQLLSHWLVSAVGYWSPNYGIQKAARGLRDGESDDTEQLYRSFAARNCRLVGTLVMQDPQSNREISINTGREDSEIVMVDQDTVWYRINDEIWSGVISDSKLAKLRMLAKDSRLVQAHWAFLGGGQ